MNEEYLEHHGILGQKWGIRRYQNSDGSLTAEGKVRYYSHETSKNTRKLVKNAATAVTAAAVIGDATTAGEFARNAAGAARKFAEGLGKSAGMSYLEATGYGMSAAANVASFMANYGELAFTATQIVGLASMGFAAYRAGKAIYSGIKQAKAKKDYYDL